MITRRSSDHHRGGLGSQPRKQRLKGATSLRESTAIFGVIAVVVALGLVIAATVNAMLGDGFTVGWPGEGVAPDAAAGGRPIQILAGQAVAIDDGAEFYWASVADASTASALLLDVASCNGRHSYLLDETDPATIRIAVRTTDAPHGDECADALLVRLQQPLGDRRVVDLVSDEQVVVNDSGDG